MQDLQFSRRFIKLINLKLQKRSTYIKDLQFSCQVLATYMKEIYKANSNQTQKLPKLQHYQRNLTNSNQMQKLQKLQHYQWKLTNSNQMQKLQKLQHYRRNLTNMNAATHIYQRIKPRHLSNFINHSPKREVEPLLQIEFAITLCLFRSCKNSKH